MGAAFMTNYQAHSTIGWLDFNDDAARKMNETLRALDEPSTLDPLGLGSIRDAFSDLIAPGTSTIHTRLRYFLFIAWICQRIEKSDTTATQFASRLRNDEATLINCLREGGEKEGVHYHFCDRAEMEKMIARGEFIEYARVHSNIYGTSIEAVRAVSDAGKTCLLDIDVQGAESVKKTDLNARFLFVAPPSFAELESRLRGRGTETEEKIQLRLQNANSEMAYLSKEGFFVRHRPHPHTATPRIVYMHIVDHE